MGDSLWTGDVILQDALPLDSSDVSSAGVSEVTRLTPSGAPIFSLAVDGAAPGSNPAAPDDRQQVPVTQHECYLTSFPTSHVSDSGTRTSLPEAAHARLAST